MDRTKLLIRFASGSEASTCRKTPKKSDITDLKINSFPRDARKETEGAGLGSFDFATHNATTFGASALLFVTTKKTIVTMTAD